MALSGNRVLTRTRDDIIKGAFRLLGLIKPGGTVPNPGIMFGDAEMALNDMISSWQAEGMGLWLKKDATLYMQKGTASYNLGPTGDHCTLSSVETEVAADAVSGASSITVDSIAGMTNGDYIGVELDSGSFQFTTINGVPSGVTVVLAAVLTDAVNENAFVFTYTSKIARPLDIDSIRVVQDNDNEFQIEPVSRDEYFAVNNKTDEGTPNLVYYDPQMTNGVLYVWQPPDDVEKRLKFTVMLPPQFFTTYTDNPDFPQEWFNTLKYSLADYMGPEYYEFINPQQYLIIQEKAREYRDTMFGRDTEPAPVEFMSVYGLE